ncbi:MAG: pyrroloquinoline quinone biosynthesis protein B [Burkholderiales bacterium]|nr:pyrroloquinoline quinone biosynthesis protein B [Burkholderiales bacterium]MDE2395273.1 pyrroloquinoline quinone biosynthesis protein B [Burkholderiales bacterium]MDE2453165.1 pyrroloquinoline quinone biosynthesis protein B [Burkholderiales bacterium]
MKIVVLHGAGGEQGITALGTNEGGWVLVNITASAARQLAGAGPAPVQAGLRQAQARAIVLTDARIEHLGGLIALRDGAPIDLYATPALFEELTSQMPVLPMLQHYCGVHWRVVPVAGDHNVASFSVEGMPNLEFTAIATRVAPPAHAAHRRSPVVGDSIALAVRDRETGQRVFCAPGLSRIGETEFAWMQQADCLLVDGLAVPEDDGPAPTCIELLPQMAARHKVLFGEGGASRRRSLAEQGIELAYDGMEIEL